MAKETKPQQNQRPERFVLVTICLSPECSRDGSARAGLEALRLSTDPSVQRPNTKTTAKLHGIETDRWDDVRSAVLSMKYAMVLYEKKHPRCKTVVGIVANVLSASISKCAIIITAISASSDDRETDWLLLLLLPGYLFVQRDGVRQIVGTNILARILAELGTLSSVCLHK